MAEAERLNGDTFGARYRLAEITLRRGKWQAARAETEAALAYARGRGYEPHPPGLEYTLGLIALRLGELNLAKR